MVLLTEYPFAEAFPRFNRGQDEHDEHPTSPECAGSFMMYDGRSIRRGHDFCPCRVPLSTGVVHVSASPPVRPTDVFMVR